MTRVKPDEEFKNDLMIEQLLWEDFMEHLDRLVDTALPVRKKAVQVLRVGKLANT